MGRRIAPPPDLDRFAERIEEPVAERVADMGVVEPAPLPGLVGEIRQLPSRGVRAGRIVEARRDPERALRHRLAEHRPHRRDRPRIGLDLVPAQRPEAESRVADEKRDVRAYDAVESPEV